MSTSPSKTRIASDFAPFPFRMLCNNQPLDFSADAGFDLSLNPKQINLEVANSILKHQAPILYADDVLIIEKLDGDHRVNFSKLRDIPMAMPPFDQMFIEVDMTTLTSRSETATKDLKAIAGFVRLDPFEHEASERLRDLIYSHATRLSERLEGTKDIADQLSGLTEKMPHKKSDIESIEEEFRKLQVASQIPKFIFRAGPIDESSIDIIETAHFVAIYCYIYMETPRGDEVCVGPLGCQVYMVDPDKGLVRDPSGHPFVFGLDPYSGSAEGDSPLYDEPSDVAFVDDCTETAAYVSMRAIALLNCSNVHIVEQGRVRPGANAKDRRIRSKRYASLVHNELRVKIGETLVPVSGERTHTGQNPLSMVRGHFRDYSKGPGLFGKYRKPAVWVPPHARGNAENGVVTKDYRLVKGEEE